MASLKESWSSDVIGYFYLSFSCSVNTPLTKVYLKSKLFEFVVSEADCVVWTSACCVSLCTGLRKGNPVPGIMGLSAKEFQIREMGK